LQIEMGENYPATGSLWVRSFIGKTKPMTEETKDQSSGQTGLGGTPFTFGVSGHRDPVTADLPELRKQLRRIFDHFQAIYPAASFRLLSPLAEGADRVAAEVALASGIQLFVPMPMAQVEYERDFTSPESLQEFRRLLSAAQSDWEVRDGASSQTSVDENGNRAQKYAAVGDYIARTSHVLIFLWDGRHNQKVGGTSWVKERREHWVRTGAAPDAFGYVGTIHLLTPRQATERGTEPRPRVEIVGGWPPAG
jgi:hypothetical protein